MSTTTASGARQGTTLERSEWAAYFDDLTRRLERGADVEATIHIVGDNLDEDEAVRMPLLNVTYEDGDDQIAIGVGGRGRRFPAALWHYVDHPRSAWAHPGDELPTALAFESEDGTLTLLRIHAVAAD